MVSGNMYRMKVALTFGLPLMWFGFAYMALQDSAIYAGIALIASACMFALWGIERLEEHHE